MAKSSGNVEHARESEEFRLELLGKFSTPCLQAMLRYITDHNVETLFPVALLLHAHFDSIVHGPSFMDRDEPFAIIFPYTTRGHDAVGQIP